jgi:hypothetical protein
MRDVIPERFQAQPSRRRPLGILLAFGYSGESLMLRSSTLSRIALLVMLGVSTAGCEVIGGIFKAGLWVGALGVLAVVVLVVVIVGKMKR